MPNMFAYLTLLVWPVVAAVLYLRLPLQRAVPWSVLGAYLFLPPATAFDFPFVPPLDKVAIPNLSALLICTLVLGKRVALLPRSGTARVLVLVFLLGSVATVLANSEPILFAASALPGLRPHDAIAVTVGQFITLIPFLLARQFLASEAALKEILLALVVGALAYSLPMLVEIRLSPQVNVWVYGFFQHDFIQMMREGGFRPIVFLPHGIWVAFFTFMALLASVSLWRNGTGSRRPLLLSIGYLSVLLVLCKTLAALLYAVILSPLLFLLRTRSQLRLAAILALIALTYPLLRGADLVPTDTMIAQAERVSDERARSLQFRFDNEDDLLERAALKPVFGWGGWGRNQIHNPQTGEIVSVTDGRWIIVIGTFGWLGYIAEFGLLALPTLILLRRAAQMGACVSPFAGTLALILGANMIDMLPNATLIPFTWLIAGALTGYAERLGASARIETKAPENAQAKEVIPRPRTIL